MLHAVEDAACAEDLIWACESALGGKKDEL
jgi:hypothetical protein